MPGSSVGLACDRVVAAANGLPPPQNLRFVISRIHAALSRNAAVQGELGSLRKSSIVKQLDSHRIEIQMDCGITVVVSVNEGYPDSPTGVTVDSIIGDSLLNIESLNSRCISSIDQACRMIKTAMEN